MGKLISINYRMANFRIEENCRRMLCRASNRDNIINDDLYSYIQLCIESETPFTVCHLNEEEFKLVENEIKIYGNLDRLLSGPRNGSYNSCRFMITRDSDASKILFTDYDNFKSIGTYSFDFKTETLEFHQDGIPFTKYYGLELFKYGYTSGLKIYTTETYENVIKYYQELTNKKQKDSMNQKMLK